MLLGLYKPSTFPDVLSVTVISMPFGTLFSVSMTLPFTTTNGACVKLVKVDGWAKHSSVGKKHLENAELRRRKFGGEPRGTRRGSAVSDPDNAEAQPIGNGRRRRRKQAGRGIKHPTKQNVSLLKKLLNELHGNNMFL